MRATKVIALLLVLLVLSALPSYAQAPRLCSSIERSLVDSMIIIETRGKPGDIINMPFTLKNTRNVAGVQMYVEIDTTKFRPIVDYVDTNITGTVQLGFDTTIVTNFQYSVTARWNAARMQPIVSDDFDQPSATPNILRLRVIGVPTSFEALPPAITPGSGQIITIPVQIMPTAQQLDYIDVGFYFLDVYDDNFVFLGCQHNNYTDTTGISLRTSTLGARLVVDTTVAPVPQIIAFTSTADTVNSGQAVTLAWQVSNADSVVLFSSVTGRLTKSTALNSSFTLSPTATASYTLTAYNVNGEANNQITVFVRGSTPGNINPVVATISPSTYTITQGETVSFSVSATDADNEFITLSALSLPANASFGTAGQVTGVGSASGNFSFTPNTTQEGTFIVGFRATDNRGGVSAQQNVTIIVEAIEYDILFSKSRAEGSPVGGLAGKQGILFPIDLVTSQASVYGVQFDFFYDDTYFTVDSIITTNRTAGWTIYDNNGQTPGELRIVTFSMEGQELLIDETDGTTILYIAMSIDSIAPWGDYPIYLEEGWESTNPDPAYPSLALVTDSAIIQVDRPGDVNLDKRVDVADAVNIVGSILGNFTLPPRQFDVADLVIDLTVDVFDLVGVINTIYGLPVEQPQPAPMRDEDMATVLLAYEDMFIGSRDDLVVHSELPEDIAGVQLTIRYDPSAVLLGVPVAAADADGLELTYKNRGGQMTVLLHFTNPFNQQQLIQRGLADLVSIPMIAQRDVEYGHTAQLELLDVKLSTATAKEVHVKGYGPTVPLSFSLRQNYPNPFNPTTRIEFSLSGANERVTLDIYNVLGQQVRRLVDRDMAAGEYSVDWDATTDNGNKVATGIYLYRLQVGNRAETKKMLLLK